jgi:hypothetical protein
MKNLKETYSSIVAMAFALMVVTIISTLSSCDGDEPAVSKQDEVKAKLIAGTWNIGSVMVDGTDKTSVYPNLKLTFTSAGFTSLNGGVIWPASGTWTFTSADATAFTRNDGLVVTIQEVTATSMKLALAWDKTTIGPGRLSSVAGQHIFTFAK